MKYRMQRARSRNLPFALDITPPHPMCKKPVEILDGDETVAVVLQTSIDRERQRETMSQFCKTVNKIDSISMFYLTRSIRTKQRERGLLVIMRSDCDRAQLQTCLERL